MTNNSKSVYSSNYVNIRKIADNHKVFKSPKIKISDNRQLKSHLQYTIILQLVLVALLSFITSYVKIIQFKKKNIILRVPLLVIIVCKFSD